MRTLATVLLLYLLWASPPAPSAIYCVGTTAELESALAQSSGDGQDDAIQLRAGVYRPTSTLRANLLSGEDLTLSGGWQNLFGPCAVQSLDAGASELDGQQQRPVLSIEGSSGSNDIEVSNLSISSGSRSAGDNSVRAAGLTIFGQPNHTGNILVDRVRFQLNASAAAGGALAIVSRQGFVVRNSVFFGNSAPAAAAMNLSAPGTGYLVNNTLLGNTAVSAGASIASIQFNYSPSSLFVLSNNLLWANALPGQDEFQASGQTLLLSNDIQVYSGTPAPASSGNLAVDPQFAPSSARLLASSPLINRGINGALGGIGGLDLDAKTRAVAAVDIGAFELQEFRNGFE